MYCAPSPALSPVLRSERRQRNRPSSRGRSELSCVMDTCRQCQCVEEGGRGHVIHALRKLSAYLLWEIVQGKLSGGLSFFVARAYKIYISFNSSGWAEHEYCVNPVEPLGRWRDTAVWNLDSRISLFLSGYGNNTARMATVEPTAKNLSCLLLAKWERLFVWITLCSPFEKARGVVAVLKRDLWHLKQAGFMRACEARADVFSGVFGHIYRWFA